MSFRPSFPKGTPTPDLACTMAVFIWGCVLDFTSWRVHDGLPDYRYLRLPSSEEVTQEGAWIWFT